MIEIIIFIDDSTFFIIQYNKNEYTPLKIKGELFFEYDNLSDSIQFLSSYLKEYFQVDTFLNTTFTIYCSSKYVNASAFFLEHFNKANLQLINIDPLLIYKNNVSTKIAAELNVLRNSYSQLVIENQNSRLPNHNLEKGKVNLRVYSNSKTQAKNISDHLYREFIFINPNTFNINVSEGAKHPFSSSGNYGGLPTQYFSILIYNGVFVNKGDEICITDQNQKIKSPSTGYLFWLLQDRVHQGDKLFIKNFEYTERQKGIAIAVISSKEKDNIIDILIEANERLVRGLQF
jgi:hypothetical protein